jgi:hypothetical protein
LLPIYQTTDFQWRGNHFAELIQAPESIMSSDLKILRDERIIQKSVSGDLNTNRARKLIHKISLVVKLDQNCSILVDIRDTTFQPQMSDLLEISTECSKCLAEFRHKIAFLIPNTEQRRKVAKLFKTCMEAHGFEFKQFFEYEDAIEWLA